MFTTFDEAGRYVADNAIEMVDLKFTDLWGRWHHVTIPAREFTPQLMERGVGFDASSVGLRGVEDSDGVLMPDLTTGARDPFFELPTLGFVCNILEADTHEVAAKDPRSVAARAEAYLRESGIADESRWGPEFEFYVFERASFDNRPHHTAYHFEAGEADWNSPAGEHGHYIPRLSGYHAIPPKDQLFNLRAEMTQILESMGVGVKYNHHEVGGPGQGEIETPMVPLVPTGDMSMTIKYVTKMVARAHDKTATFMPKPLYAECANGLHFHQQLFKDGTNAFYDPDGYANLSQTALYYIGGLLTHVGAVLALTSPSTNSYRRLVPGYEAPVNAFFGLANRTAAIRIPRYAWQPDAVRIEFRPPDSSSNVYFALAAQLLAGLDGIQKRIDPTEAGFGPIADNVFAWPPEKRADIKQIPGSLEEALDALEADHDFLLAGGVFDEGLLEQYVAHKRVREAHEVRNRPHPYEVELYFDV